MSTHWVQPEIFLGWPTGPPNQGYSPPWVDVTNLPIGGQGGPSGTGTFPNQTPATVDSSLSANSLSGLLPLLQDSGQLDELGPLFRTLLALQGGGKGGQNDIFSLFSGIQL